MYALDNDSGVKTMPEIKSKKFEPADTHWFTEGGNGVAPSYPGADWFNIVQAELLNILTDAGMTPDKGQFNQITQAIRAIVSASVKTSLNDKAPIASPIFTGTPKAPTPAQTVNDTTVATTAYVRAAIAALVGTAPATLDTLSEIANALAGDANVKATLLAEIGKKANASHTHTVENITNFNTEVNKLINTGVSYRKVGESTIFKFNDGSMIQTGQITGLFDERNVAVIFPEAFHDKPATIQLTEIVASTSMGHATQLVALDWKNTGFTAWRNSTQDNRESKACFLAIGRWK